jgi:hypothetical protein
VTGVASGLTRTRGARPIEGSARPRPILGGVDDPRFIGWYPWYGSRFSGYFGYGAYDPWLFGSSWGWSRYGWYDPFWRPYGYSIFDPYGFGYGHHYWGTPYVVMDRDDDDDDVYQNYGSLRIRADPKSARVYVDGALAGTVDDFDGLTSHLPLAQGVHQIEIRADGYETYSAEVTIEAGKTRTERARLERVE